MTSWSEDVATRLLQATSIWDEQVRTAILADVWGRHPPRFGVNRSNDAVVDMGNIARACEERGDLADLVDVASKHVPSTIFQQLQELIRRQQEPPPLQSLRALLPKVEFTLDYLATLCAMSAPGYPWKSEQRASPASVVAVLAQMPGLIGEETPLVRFVVGLLGMTSQPPQVAAALSTWITAEWGLSAETLMTLRQRYVKEKAAASQRTPVLVIELAPKESFLYDLRAWLWRDVGDVLPWDQNPTSVQVGDATESEGTNESNEDLQRIVSDTYDWARGQAGTSWTRLSVEFILPRELLCRQVEHLHINYGAVKDAELGLRFPVVVRPYERLQHYDALREIWNETWNKIAANVGALHLVPIDGGLTASQLEGTTAYLNELEYAHCLVFTFVPPRRAVVEDQDALVRLFASGGSAAAIWSRRKVDLSAPLAEEFKFRPPSQLLPKFGQNLRIKATMKDLDWARDLVVLWDDPARLPPDYAPAAAFADE